MKSVSMLWIGALLGAGFAFLTQSILARALDVSIYGDFSAAFATVSLLAPLAAFGVSGFWLNVFGREGASAVRWLTPSFKFSIISGIGIFLFLILWGSGGPHSEVVRLFIMILALHVLGQGAIELVSCKSQLEGDYFSVAVWQFLPNFLRMMLVGVVYLLCRDHFVFGAYFYAWVYFFVALIILILAGFRLSRAMNSPFYLKHHAVQVGSVMGEGRASVLEVLKKTWPFGMATVFHLIYFQSDIVLVNYMAGSEAAGFYSVAFLIMSGVYLLPGVIYQKYMQLKIHVWANNDLHRLRKSYRHGNLLMLALGILSAVLVFLISPGLINIAFGEKYSPAVALVSVLALCAPLRFVSTSVGALLLTGAHASNKVKCMGIVAVFNIILNIALIPRLGAMGAAWSTVFSEVLLLCLYFYYAEKYVFEKI